MLMPNGTFTGIRNTEQMDEYLNKWYEERIPTIQQWMMKVRPV